MAQHDNGALHLKRKYPLSIRLLHWVRALLIFGLLWSGWTMTRFPDGTEKETFEFFYSNHKQFGVLVWLLALCHLVLRHYQHRHFPAEPQGLARWEQVLSHIVHRLIMALTLLVPMMGYALSSSYSGSAGVPFFFVERLPELLPKNDTIYPIFSAAHQYLAYALLTLVALHIIGALKHRFLDKGGDSDVLPRMI